MHILFVQPQFQKQLDCCVKRKFKKIKWNHLQFYEAFTSLCSNILYTLVYFKNWASQWWKPKIIFYSNTLWCSSATQKTIIQSRFKQFTLMVWCKCIALPPLYHNKQCFIQCLPKTVFTAEIWAYSSYSSQWLCKWQ